MVIERFLGKVLFPGAPHGQRHRHVRFLLLGILLGLLIALTFGAVLYLLHEGGRV